MTVNPNLGFIYHGLVYLSLFMGSWWAYKTESLKFFSEKGWAKNIKIHFFLLALGIFAWGVIPIFLSGQTSSLLLIFGDSPPTSIQLMLVVILASVAFMVTRTQSKKLDINATLFQPYPTNFIFSSYFVFRLLFLISYEIWFRGFFFEELVIAYSTPFAIGINLLFYALIHIFGGIKEALGSIVFGVILCLMVLYIGSVWPAIIIHLSLSLGYEGSFFAKRTRKHKINSFQEKITE